MGQDEEGRTKHREEAIEFASGYEGRPEVLWTDGPLSRGGVCAEVVDFFESDRERGDGAVIPRRGILGAGRRREKLRKDYAGASRSLAGGERGPG